jgi:NTP pyrophosphatase (non-canonical NTP hydrolase)
MRLTFEELRAKNKTRMQRWHGAGPEWTVADWAVAFAGEAGEMCNAVKKLKRVRGGFANKNDDPARQLDTEEKALAAIAEELADTIIYADLLADHLGLDLGSAIAAKFNKTSDQYGFPEKLGETSRGTGRLGSAQIEMFLGWLERMGEVAGKRGLSSITEEGVAVMQGTVEFCRIGLALVREHAAFTLFYADIRDCLNHNEEDDSAVGSTVEFVVKALEARLDGK